MKPKAWLCQIAVSILLCGCSEASTVTDDTTDPEHQGQTENNDSVDPCRQITCQYGCADGACVDFRSDPNHCGQADNICSTPAPFCKNGMCVADCNSEGAKICKGQCIDTRNNVNHCGKCEHHCADNMVCSNGECICADEFVDCNGNALDGCEMEADLCECTPGETQSCYSGNPATLGVGICKAGQRTCLEDGYFDFCRGEVLPDVERIGNGLDDDCDNQVDEGIHDDADKDGWTIAQGDCCDSYLTCKANDPAKINPGAIDEVGNKIDDDCDGIIDNPKPVATCSTAAYTPVADTAVNTADAIKLAQAMDICMMTSSDAYGLIEAKLLHADATALEASCNATLCGNATHISPAEQMAVATTFGGSVNPILGNTLVVLSSGKAQGKENAGFKDCMGSEVNAPKAYLDAHNGVLPVSTLCNKSASGVKANDSVMLRLKLKAPSNANGFKFKFKFFSKEYPTYVCEDYNDFFLALLDSQHPDIPKDHNISFDTNGNPVSVNNAFFTECDKTACKPGVNCSCDSIGDVAAYVTNTKTAGATRWLETTAPILPGETFTLDLIIFDAGDFTPDSTHPTNTSGWGHQRDSLVLIDAFEWKTEPTELKTVIY